MRAAKIRLINRVDRRELVERMEIVVNWGKVLIRPRLFSDGVRAAVDDFDARGVQSTRRLAKPQN